MKPIGYIIYHFWDFKHALGDEEWQTSTTQPHPEFKKRIYRDLFSAEDAVKQMTKIDNNNTYYHILPIFTPTEEYDKVIEAYQKRLEENKK
jgi:hypothetical protein